MNEKIFDADSIISSTLVNEWRLHKFTVSFVEIYEAFSKRKKVEYLKAFQRYFEKENGVQSYK